MKKKSKTPDKLSDLQFDDKNINAGSPTGNNLLKKSLRKLKAGRSILLDKNNRIIAGNKTVEAAMANGMNNLRIIETTGDEIIAVKRNDIDLDSKQGRELAIADNQVQSVNYEVNEEIAEQVLTEYDIDPDEWHLKLSDEPETKDPEEVELKAFKQTHVLISFPPDKLIEIQDLLQQIRNVEGVEYEQSSN